MGSILGRLESWLTEASEAVEAALEAAVEAAGALLPTMALEDWKETVGLAATVSTLGQFLVGAQVAPWILPTYLFDRIVYIQCCVYILT